MFETMFEAIIGKWVPALISVIAGGLVASVLVPRWQAKSNRNRLIEQRKLEICEGISDTFPKYIANWRRLIEISKHEIKKKSLSQDEIIRKNSYINDRDRYRDELFSLFSKAKLYFSKEISDLIEEFVQFDNSFSSKRIYELPDIEKWNDWESRIVGALILFLGGNND